MKKVKEQKKEAIVLYFDRELYDNTVEKLEALRDYAVGFKKIWDSLEILPPFSTEHYKELTNRGSAYIEGQAHLAMQEAAKQVTSNQAFAKTLVFKTPSFDQNAIVMMKRGVAELSMPGVPRNLKTINYFDQLSFDEETGEPGIKPEAIAEIKRQCTIYESEENKTTRQVLDTFVESYNQLRSAGLPVYLSRMCGAAFQQDMDTGIIKSFDGKFFYK